MNKKRKTRETSTVLQWRRKGQPNWLELPRDVLSAIFVKVGAIEVLRNVRRVCSEWRNLSEDPIIWHTIDMHHRDGIAYCSDNILDAMCRRAIDLSSGQLTDITVDNFATDSLLKYITDSVSVKVETQLLSNSGEVGNLGTESD